MSVWKIFKRGPQGRGAVRQATDILAEQTSKMADKAEGYAAQAELYRETTLLRLEEGRWFSRVRQVADMALADAMEAAHLEARLRRGGPEFRARYEEALAHYQQRYTEPTGVVATPPATPSLYGSGPPTRPEIVPGDVQSERRRAAYDAARSEFDEYVKELQKTLDRQPGLRRQFRDRMEEEGCGRFYDDFFHPV